MLNNLKVGTKLKTKSGLSVRIICTDAKIGGGDYSIVALVEGFTNAPGEFIEWYSPKDYDKESNLLLVDTHDELILDLSTIEE